MIAWRLRIFYDYILMNTLPWQETMGDSATPNRGDIRREARRLREKKRPEKVSRMHDDLQTDEYCISISREITVCKNMIDRQQKELARFEKQHGLSTERLIAGEMPEIGGEARDIEAWRNGYEGLLAWQQRLLEYEEAYNALRR